ncbi:MAG: arsenate reductase family protein [Syntrophorhabdus sp.]
MNIQIFGKNKCPDTRAAQRFFKERGIKFQYIDLGMKGLSKGELNSVKSVIGIENLVDTQGKEYEKLNLKYLTHDIEEEILAHPLLLKTPIVRNGSKATVGNQQEIWKEWIRLP